MSIDIVELRRLHGAATAGEWQVTRDDCHFDTASDITVNFVRIAQTCSIYPALEHDDAAIVALHNAAPALLDAADELARVKAVMDSKATVETLSRIIAKALTGGTASKPKLIDVKAAQSAIAEIDRLIWPF